MQVPGQNAALKTKSQGKPKKPLSETMIKLLEEALQKKTLKEDLKLKLKKNDKNVLIKYTKRLEISNVGEANTQEQILDAICEFLVTDEGKRMAAHNLSEVTY